MSELDKGLVKSEVKEPFEEAVGGALKLSIPVTKTLELEGRINSLERSNSGRASTKIPLPEGVPHLAVDLGRAISNVLTNPSDEQRKRWTGLSEEQIREQIAGQVRSFAEERGIAIE